MIGDKANGCRTLHLEPLFQPGFPHWYGLHLEPFPKCRIYAIPKAFWKIFLGSKWSSGTIYIYTKYIYIYSEVKNPPHWWHFRNPPEPGTALGDPIEVGAQRAVYGKGAMASENHRKTMGKPWEKGGFMGF